MRAAVPLLACAGLMMAAVRVAAQTAPLPTVPAQRPTPTTAPDADAATPEPAADAVANRPRSQPWEYALSAGLGWDGNIDFLAPDGPSDAMLVPRASLTRIFSGPRGSLRATAAGRWTGYRERADLRRYYGDLDLDGTYLSSPGTEWRGRASYELGDAVSSRVLLEQGVALPRVKVRSLSGALSLIQKLGTPRTSLRVDGRFFRTAFEARGLVDGESLRGTIALQRQLSLRSTAAVQYALEDVLSDASGRAYLTHFASLQWTRVLSPRSAVLLEAGASDTPEAERAGLEARRSFFGGLSVVRSHKRSGLTFFLRREVAPAFGTGTSRLELRAGLGATLWMGRDWELRILGSHVQPETRRALTEYGSADDAGLVLGRHLGRQLAVSAEARYRRRGPTSAMPRLEAFQAGVFLTLLSPSVRPVELPTPP